MNQQPPTGIEIKDDVPSTEGGPSGRIAFAVIFGIAFVMFFGAIFFLFLMD